MRCHLVLGVHRAGRILQVHNSGERALEAYVRQAGGVAGGISRADHQLHVQSVPAQSQGMGGLGGGHTVAG